MKSNIEIRRLLFELGVRFYQVADELEMTEANFSRKMRKEFSKEEKERIIKIVQKLKKEEN